MKACPLRFLALIGALVVGPAVKGGVESETAADSLADARALVAAHPGLRIMRVRGESMEPFFSDGSVVVVKEISAARLQQGMVVVYCNRFGEVIAHRIVAGTAGVWRVKGQNNNRADSTLVTAANLIGVVYATFNAAPPATPALGAVEVVLAAPAR